MILGLPLLALAVRPVSEKLSNGSERLAHERVLNQRR